jgi:hypothetical protein
MGRITVTFLTYFNKFNISLPGCAVAKCFTVVAEIWLSLDVAGAILFNIKHIFITMMC